MCAYIVYEARTGVCVYMCVVSGCAFVALFLLESTCVLYKHPGYIFKEQILLSRKFPDFIIIINK